MVVELLFISTGTAGLTIQYVRNSIIHGIDIHDIHAGSGGLIGDSFDHYGLSLSLDHPCLDRS